MQDRFRAMMGFGAVALLTGAIAAACSSDTTEPPPGNNNEDNVILLQANTFAPALDSIDVGETITWRNAQAIGHTITSDDGEWPRHVVPEEEDYEFVHTFDMAGTYDYECEFHTGMVGTIVVE